MGAKSMAGSTVNINKRSWKIIAGAVGGFVLLYGATSYWMGIKAQETLTEQHRMLSGLALFTVKSHSYQRGWFSSEEVTELALNQRLVGPYVGMLPDNLRPLLSGTIRYRNQVRHGPLPGLADFSLIPARAIVKTEFDMSPATRKTLQRFFGEAEPITVTNRLGFGGGGELDLKIPRFDYEETLAGVKMNWQGFGLKVDYRKGFTEYQLEADSPGFLLNVASRGSFAFNGVRYLSDTRPGDSGVKLGTAELTVGDVKLDWKENVPYSIKLNELVYLLTQMRVGEFVNPSGEFRPNSAALNKLRYQIVTSEQDQFVNTRGKLDFASLRFDRDVYGPFRLDVSANHLHAPTLVKLDHALSQIPFEGVDPTELRKRYIATITREGVPLLENDPKLVVNELYLKMPSGEAKLSGSLALTGFKADDLKSPVNFIKRFVVQASVELPRPTLENLVVAQARNLFTVDASAEEQPNMAEIDNLARSLLDAQLAEWLSRKLIEQQGNQLKTRLDFRDGLLKINQQPVELPWHEEEEPAAAPAAS